MSDSPKQEQITIELFNGLCEAIDDVNLRECAERLGHFAVARPTALMEETQSSKSSSKKPTIGSINLRYSVVPWLIQNRDSRKRFCNILCNFGNPF